MLGAQDVGRARLELAVLDDGEARAAVAQLGEVDLDAALARRLVGCIRQVAGLGTLHRVDPVDLHQESAFLKTSAVRRSRQGATPLAPNIALKDVVIVGDDDARAILQDRAPSPAELPVLAQVIEHCLFGRFPARNAESPVDLIDLIAGEINNARLLQRDDAHHSMLRKNFAVIARENADPQAVFFSGVLADDAAPVVLLLLPGVGAAVAGIAAVVPIADTKHSRAR